MAGRHIAGPCTTVSGRLGETNELVSRLHDRMPVVIASEDRERWLSDPDSSDLLRPFPAEQMTCGRCRSL